MSTEMDRDGHRHDELQELLDGRRDAERERAVRSHLEQCLQCQREIDALRWVKRALHEVPEAPLPPSLEGQVRGALEAEDRLPRTSRRNFLAAAASLLLGG